MIITTVLVIVGFASLGFLIKIRKGYASPRILESPAEHIHPVDVVAFRNLIDPEEEDFLRRSLPPAEFRKMRRLWANKSNRGVAIRREHEARLFEAGLAT